MLQAGIGPTHVNAFLTSINLTPVGQNKLKAREREVSLVIEAVAKKSCAEAIEAEKRCWIDEQQETESGSVKIGASYDLGWQKRGKGHNSLTGGQIVTWHEPLPAETVSSPETDLTPAEIKVFEGYPASLSWNFSLTSVTLYSVRIAFNTDTLAISGPGGSAAKVEDAFKDRFNFTWISQRLTLEIFDVTAADDESNGVFRCELITKEEVWKREIGLKIIEPARIVDVTRDQDACEEAKVTLSCNATGKPEPNITWTRVWENGTDSGALQSKDGYFVLDNIGRGSSGTYRCTAFNGVGEPVNHSVKVIVLFPPTIYNTSSCIIYVKKGEMKNLKCYAAGHPKPNITWTLKGKVQDSDGNSLSITPQETGAYSYKCKAENGIENSTEATVGVVVEIQAGALLKFSITYVHEGFTPELNGDKSAKYWDLDKEVQKLKEAFPKCFSIEIKVERFSPNYDGAGVVAFVDLIFNATMGAEAATSYLQDAAKEGKLGNVDADSVTYLEAIPDPKKCVFIYEDDQLCKTVQRGWIIGLSLVGVVVAGIVIAVSANYVNKKWRGRKVNSVAVIVGSNQTEDNRTPPGVLEMVRRHPAEDNSRKRDVNKNKKAAEQKPVDDQNEVDKFSKKNEN